MKKIVFYALGGKGFGHISRCLAITDALLERSHEMEIHLITSALNPIKIEESRVITHFLPLKESPELYHLIWQGKTIGRREFEQLLMETLLKIQPDIVIFDYLFKGSILRELAKLNIQTVLILRRKKNLQMEVLLTKSRLLEEFSVIILPHNVDEIKHIPAWLAPKMSFVGRVARTTDYIPFKEARNRFGVNPESKWILASVGGGGYPGELDKMAKGLEESLNICGSVSKQIHITLFSGAFTSNKLLQVSNNFLQIVPFDLDFRKYLKAADLVVTQAGYNTVSEVIDAKIPSILIPASRNMDDQFERASQLAEKGLAIICEKTDNLPSVLSQIIADGFCLDKIRDRLADIPISNGQYKAAQILLDISRYSENKQIEQDNTDEAQRKLLISPFSSCFVESINVTEELPKDIVSELSKCLQKGARGVQLVVNNEDLLGIRSKEIKRALKYSQNDHLSFRVTISPPQKDRLNSFKEDIMLDRYSGRHLNEVNLRIIRGCNSRCSFCNHWRDPDWRNQIISEDKAFDLIRVLSEIGTRKITFNGGEPTLHPHLSKFCSFASGKGMLVKINTNAFLLAKHDLAERLKDNGVKEFLVSLHGPEEQSGLLRNIPNSTKKTLDGIRSITRLENSPKVRTNTVITRRNFREIPNTLMLAVDLGVKEANLSMVDCLKDVDNREFLLTRSDLETYFFEILPKCLELSSSYGVKLKISPLFYDIVTKRVESGNGEKDVNKVAINMLENTGNKYEEEIEHFEIGDYGKCFYNRVGCFVPARNCYIMANGDVFPCLRAIGYDDALIFGNIYHQSLASILNTKRWLNYAQHAGTHQVCNTCKNLFEANYKLGLESKAPN